MSIPSFYGVKPLESLGSSADFRSRTAFLPPRRVVTRLLDAVVRWQIRRLDRRIAAMKLDDRVFHLIGLPTEVLRPCPAAG